MNIAEHDTNARETRPLLMDGSLGHSRKRSDPEYSSSKVTYNRFLKVSPCRAVQASSYYASGSRGLRSCNSGITVQKIAIDWLPGWCSSPGRSVLHTILYVYTIRILRWPDLLLTYTNQMSHWLVSVTLGHLGRGRDYVRMWLALVHEPLQGYKSEKDFQRPFISY